MSPVETVTFICGIILCIIGVCTFVTGMISRAKGEGILSNKVDNALKGIDEIKSSLIEQRNWREEIGIITERQQQQIDTLFRRVTKLENKIN